MSTHSYYHSILLDCNRRTQTFQHRYHNKVSSDQMTDTRYVCGMCQTRTSVKQVQANLNVVEDEDVDFHDISSGQESVPIRMYGDTSTLKRLKSEFVSYITSPVMSPCVRIDWKQSVEACCIPTSTTTKTSVLFRNVHTASSF